MSCTGSTGSSKHVLATEASVSAPVWVGGRVARPVQSRNKFNFLSFTARTCSGTRRDHSDVAVALLADRTPGPDMAQICCGTSFFLTFFSAIQSSSRPWVRNVGSADITVVSNGIVGCAKVRTFVTVAVSDTVFKAEALRQYAQTMGSDDRCFGFRRSKVAL